jgi:poly(glycerol-phosphate) alpha-glucosyltransferase
MLDPWAVQNSGWKKRAANLLFEGRHLRNAACIRALCDSEARAIRAYDLRNPICVIPNGVDIPNVTTHKTELSHSISENGSSASGRKVLLYLGRIHPKKGLVNLLKAWRMAQNDLRKSEEWTLAIAGWDAGGHENELKRLARELGLAYEESQAPTGSRATSLVFLGPQFGKAKAACYKNCNAFILPSCSEGLPMVTLEAWAHGKPVLMTPQCNLAEGFACNAALRIETTVKSIKHGLNLLFEMEHGERQAMGVRGLDLVTKRFTWPKIGQQMREVYEWALGGGPKPATLVEE